MIKALILAMQFLTRIPINIPIDFNKENIRRSTLFFPYVGMVLGALSYIPYYFLQSQSREIGSVLSLLMMIVLTGGLHLDGLSDSFDGFFSNKNKEDILEIMKDSRIGAFGVLSLIMLILFKYIIISNFRRGLFLALIFSMGNARLAVIFQIAFKKIARPGGLGDLMHKSKARNYIILTSNIYLIINIIFGYKFLLALIVSLLVGELISLFTYKKIGGFTGDVYGATIEIIEAFSLLTFWGILNWI